MTPRPTPPPSAQDLGVQSGFPVWGPPAPHGSGALWVGVWRHCLMGTPRPGLGAKMGSVQVGSGWPQCTPPQACPPGALILGAEEWGVQSGSCPLCCPASQVRGQLRPSPTSPPRQAEPAEGHPVTSSGSRHTAPGCLPTRGLRELPEATQGRGDGGFLDPGGYSQSSKHSFSLLGVQRGFGGLGWSWLLRTLLRSWHHCRGSRLLCEDGRPVLWVPHSSTCPQVPPLPARVGSTAGRVFQGPRAWAGEEGA